MTTLRDWFRLALAAIGSGVSPGTMVPWVVKYTPVILAIVKVIEKVKTEQEWKERLSDFERAFRVLAETNNPTQLEEVLRKHCRPDTGCVLE